MNANVKAEEQTTAPTSKLIDWFAVGQECEIELGGATIRFHVVGQIGRRVRIAVSSPAGSTYSTQEGTRMSARD